MAQVLQNCREKNDLITWLQTKDSKKGFEGTKAEKLTFFKVRKGKNKQTAKENS